MGGGQHVCDSRASQQNLASVKLSVCNDTGIAFLCADVHMVLADVSMEQENFEAAAEDYGTALKLLAECQQVQLLPCTMQ